MNCNGTARTLALVSAALWLAACGNSETLPPVPLVGTEPHRVTLPSAPTDIEPCLRAPFPEIPDRDLSAADGTELIGAAKLLDRRKTACGLRAVQFIKAERTELAR